MSLFQREDEQWGWYGFGKPLSGGHRKCPWRKQKRFQYFWSHALVNSFKHKTKLRESVTSRFYPKEWTAEVLQKRKEIWNFELNKA